MLSADQVPDIFDYRDGALYWRIQPSKGTPAGSLAGSVYRRRACDRGREQHVVKYRGERYTRGQLVWAWHHGRWPDHVLGRWNDDTLDDRIENLRVADVAAPYANDIDVPADTTGGYKCCFSSSTWRARPESLFCENRNSNISHCETEADRGAL